MSGLPADVDAALARGWSLQATEVREVAHGPLSATWRVAAADGAAYAVRRGRAGTTGGLAAAVTAAAAGVPGVAAPLAAADGAAWVLLEDDRPLSVVPWLDGVPALSARLGRRHWTALGETVGRLHAMAPEGLPPARRPEPVALVTRLEDVRRRVLTARTGGAALGPLRAGLREHRRLLDRASRVLAAPRRDVQAVVCHGDPHPGNVLLVDDRPVLVDWEDAGTAPRELDLLFVVDGGILERRVGEDELGWFTRGYGRVLDPDADELAWQRTLRAVEDVVLFAEAALDEALDLGTRVAQARWAQAALTGLR